MIREVVMEVCGIPEEECIVKVNTIYITLTIYVSNANPNFYVDHIIEKINLLTNDNIGQKWTRNVIGHHTKTLEMEIKKTLEMEIKMTCDYNVEFSN